VAAVSDIDSLSQADRPPIASGQTHHTGAHVYARAPLEYRNEIPVFSASDQYSANYERIAQDHLAVATISGKNPFIEEEVWVELEASTAELVKKYSSPRNLILDVGVGLGRLLSRFNDLERYGMDISLDYLMIAKRKGIEVCLARVEDMPYKDGLFDVVVCTDVLEHVFDLNLCVGKILQCLKPHGYLIVRVPYREDLSAYASPGYPYHYAHVRNFDEFSLSLLFNKLFNAQVIEFTTVGRSLDWARMVYRLPIGNRTFAKAVRALKRLFPPLGKAIGFRMFTPVEINMVFKKS
jgi:2-polyprenyl-3-methyl-5-hydroxy-6-metoxy-1,4-benzoquinol methylase